MEIEESNKKPKESLVTKQIRTNPWILSTIVLGVLAIILVIGNTSVTGKVVSKDNIGDAVISYFEEQGAVGLELTSVEESEGLYEVKVAYMGQEIAFYVTKSGYLVAGNELVPLFEEENGLEKSDVPVVDLFVMTYCPYGTQAEKGIIPVLDTLGDSVNANIRFVHYFMHGDKEEEETYRQICIREEQSDKYLDYLKCFLEGDGNIDDSGYMANGKEPSECIERVGIDESALNECIENNAKAYYAEDSALSQEYGVKGSPTLIINGKQVNSGRDPASYLDSICQAFSEAPEICGTELVSEASSAGFGWEGSGYSTSAQC